MPAQFSIGGTWYMNTPNMIPATPPHKIQPMSKITWSYVNPGELANEGIYSKEDLDRMSEQIMFPMGRPAVSNAFAGGIAGKKSLPEELTIAHLFDD